MRLLRISILLAFALAGCATQSQQAAVSTPAVQARVVSDTIDVPVGSVIVDMSDFTDHGTLIVGNRMSGGTATHVLDMTTRLTTGDSVGLPGRVLRIHSEQDRVAGPFGPPGGKQIEDLTLDRQSLAVRAWHTHPAEGMGRTGYATFNGSTVRGSLNMGGKEQQVAFDLSEPAFYGPGIDYVIEHLPMRAGAVYRLPVFRPGDRFIQRRLYHVVGTEAIDALGVHHPNAWRVEELSPDGKQQLSTLWIVHGTPSYLARWDYGTDPTSMLRLEQKLAP
ncbi:MAG: hypothetical protein M3Z54_06425 [Gemmatimonadota bacterium]|nr:hypothetical protein [Gemmatimonadota bacterium]